MATITCGADKSTTKISSYLKCYITQGDVTVIGLLGESAELAIRHLWESPFMGDAVGSSGMIDRASGLAQIHTGATSKTTLTTQQVYEGSEPPEVPLELNFIAISDAKHEVDDPIRYLKSFSSTDLREALPIGTDGEPGRIPQVAEFNIGRKMIAEMLIVDVTYNLNAPKTKDGYYAHNKVMLTVRKPTMLNRYEISSIFPSNPNSVPTPG